MQACGKPDTALALHLHMMPKAIVYFFPFLLYVLNAIQLQEQMHIHQSNEGWNEMK